MRPAPPGPRAEVSAAPLRGYSPSVLRQRLANWNACVKYQELGKPRLKENGMPLTLPFSPDTNRWRRAATLEQRKLGVDV